MGIRITKHSVVKVNVPLVLKDEGWKVFVRHLNTGGRPDLEPCSMQLEYLFWTTGHVVDTDCGFNFRVLGQSGVNDAPEFTSSDLVNLINKGLIEVLED